MIKQLYITQLTTIFRKEFFRGHVFGYRLSYRQSLQFLYITIFGNFIGSRLGDISGLPYIQFILPGLIIMPIISNSYMNVVGSFIVVGFKKVLRNYLYPHFQVM